MKTFKKSIFTVLTIVAFMENGYSNNSDKVKMVETNDTIQAKQSKQVSIQDTSKVYSCPMHPEVTAAKPGFCPKCGMELVLQKSGSNTPNHKMGMMDMLHGGNHHSHGWMYVAGGALMIVMMAIMIL